MKTTIKYSQPTLALRLQAALNDVRDYLTLRQREALFMHFHAAWTRALIPCDQPGVQFRRRRLALNGLYGACGFVGIEGLPVRAIARYLVNQNLINPKLDIH